MNEKKISKPQLRVLVLEPYYGGSHKTFLTQIARLPFAFTFLTFPARKWKWRMRLSAPIYAQKLHEQGRRYDRILCSTFVDVAAFRGLAPSWVREVPILTYFHENQFAYPVQVEEERDFHFALTNMTTSLASDVLAFNSAYNLESFLAGIEELQKKSYDLKLEDSVGRIRDKAQILPPAIDFSLIDEGEAHEEEGVPVILWNHRWEHDKNPEDFFEALFALDREGIDFRLIVLGQSFRDIPPVFTEARRRLANRIVHFGYAPSWKEYAHWLRQGDIVVSTANHEFFGMAVLEAVRAGCRPLLPKRLSYPELFPTVFLYQEGELLPRLKELLSAKRRLSGVESRELTERFSWDYLESLYLQWLEYG
jgi:glycosyltransferase involved in cell wall biosynthesis